MGFCIKMKAFLPVFTILCLIAWAGAAQYASGRGAAASPYQGEELINAVQQENTGETPVPLSVIPVDEVRMDMEAYCLTVFSGTKVEKFPLKIVSVVKNHRPGQDMILVVGDDERFNHASAIHGCSGSPVYIDGRLAGALAAGWDGSVDALYLVRPIKDMLDVGTVESVAQMGRGASAGSVLNYDFNQPLDLAAYYQQSMERLAQRGRAAEMMLPLSGSISADVSTQFGPALRGMGLMPVGGASMPAGAVELNETFEPGGVLSLVLCGGDISLAATGTVTAVTGSQIFGFGHSFNGEGAVNLPIAAGLVHTVVASRDSSFKFASPGQVIGTLLHDQTCAVRGVIGQQPQTIPLKIGVDYYNDPQDRVYNCFLAQDRTLTPMILQVALTGAGEMQGTLPFEHTVRYSGNISLNGLGPIHIDNVSSGQNLSDVVMDTYSAVGLLMNNPFEEAKIDSIEVKMTVEPRNMAASIWSVNVSNTRVRPGQTIHATVAMKSYRSLEETVSMDFDVPQNLSPGKYVLQILGAQQYQAFVSKMAPQRFRAFDMSTLKSGLSDLFQYRRDRLYAVMAVPSTGIVLRQHELSNLPGTKMLLMQDAKRLEPLEPYRGWAESRLSIDRIVQGAAQVELTVEQQS
ncbi:MAG: hypothetical protein LLF76_14000 [Planctomycetaceae bacterium]|nr:hypothetical protein [Planctomycetaceae bacterium]